MKVSRNLEGMAALAEDRHGEPMLILKLGAMVDQAFAKAVDGLVHDVTTYRAARKTWLSAPHNYHQAAMALGVPWRWLARRVATDPSFPHSKAGSHVRFTGQDLEEIRHRIHRGELRHAFGRPPHGGGAT